MEEPKDIPDYKFQNLQLIYIIQKQGAIVNR